MLIEPSWRSSTLRDGATERSDRRLAAAESRPRTQATARMVLRVGVLHGRAQRDMGVLQA